MDEKSTLGPASPEAMAALATVAKVLGGAGDRLGPGWHERVEGFEYLPEQLQVALKGMSADELGTLGRICPELIDHGFFVKTANGPLCMF